MLKLITDYHETLCSGAEYVGVALFDGKTVRDVLNEIKEYAKLNYAKPIGEGFGSCIDGGNWGIRVNGKRFLGSWNNWEQEYIHEYDDYIVTRVDVSGGWYCFYDFHITCEKATK